jgi:hypothetical protein
MTSKSVVPGVGTNTQKAPRATKPRAPKKSGAPVVDEHSDLRPRTASGPAHIPAGIDPTKLASHMANLEGEVHAQTEAAQQRHAGSTPVLNIANREELAQALQDMGLLPRVVAESGHQQGVDQHAAAPHVGSVVSPAQVGTAHVPSLVSQGLVNVLMQVRQMPTQLVEAKLDDLAGILSLREGAVTPEARQRYTLMACVQIVQDFEQLWATPAAPLR